MGSRSFRSGIEEFFQELRFFEVVAAFVNANKTAHGDANPYKNDQKQQIASEPTSLIKLILTFFTIVFRATDANPI